jgi:hypothetical protein
VGLLQAFRFGDTGHEEKRVVKMAFKDGTQHGMIETRADDVHEFP